LSIFTELKRRNALRVGAAYLAAAWLLIQVADSLFPLSDLPDSVRRDRIRFRASRMISSAKGRLLGGGLTR